MDDAVPIASQEREWIAAVATFLKATDAPAAALSDNQKLALPLGTRLTGIALADSETSWWIGSAAIGGVPLGRPIWYLDKADWTILQDGAERSLPPIAATSNFDLVAERMTGRRWSFGALAETPYSTLYYFGADGRINGLTGPNHKLWNVRDGRLRMYSESGRLSFMSDVTTLADGKLRLIGTRLLSPKVAAHGVLTELGAGAPAGAGAAAAAPVAVAAAPAVSAPPAAAEAPTVAAGVEIVKLVIWDLDETFWRGTLTEGGITPIAAHIDLVKALTARGIVNSVCSKNDYDRTRDVLVSLGIWDHFIFPRIAFAPKGAMIADIIEAAQLRAPSVLFIDDNKMNLNEALHYNPGLQVAEPDAIAGLLADPRLAGKPDPEHTRLARYKVLEKKALDQEAAGTDNLDFLRQSEIKVSFHHNVLDEFPRIHDLVNRTNQLNFTKLRWPEDLDEARALYEAELKQHFNSHAGYIKVADRYGNYGIVGFYFLQNDACRHYTFSCRTLNMGVEQFVWQKLGRPFVSPVGEVVAELGASPDWITVVDDADDDAEDRLGAAKKLLICVRGACDLRQTTHYLRTKFEMIEEFTYPYKRWGIYPVARAGALYDEVSTEAGRAFVEKVPGIPPGRFDSAIHTGQADIYMLSFSTEVMSVLYRSKSTGMIMPLSIDFMNQKNFRDVPYDDIADKAEPIGLSRADWEFLQNEFDFHAGIDETLFAADVEKIFYKLRHKVVVVLLLNEKVGSNRWLIEKWGRLNSIVRPLARAFNFHTVELNEFVRTTGDLTEPGDNGAHFNRHVYQKLSVRLTEIIASHQELAAPPALVPA
jgi:FkbH-like protein